MKPIERLFKMVDGGTKVIGHLRGGSVEGLVTETTIFIDDPSEEDLTNNDVELIIFESPSTTPARDSLVSLKEVSEDTDIPVTTLRDWCNKGRVQAKKVDGKWFLNGRIVDAKKLAGKWYFKQLK